MSHFLAMGGYAAYVCPCYGLVFAVIVGNIIWVKRRHRFHHES